MMHDSLVEAAIRDKYSLHTTGQVASNPVFPFSGTVAPRLLLARQTSLANGKLNHMEPGDEATGQARRSRLDND